MKRIETKQKKTLSKKSQQQMCDDMRKLFLDKELSDVQLVCGTQCFTVT